MSRLVGDRMPEEVVRALDGTDLEAGVGHAYLLVTTDPDGAPRACMVSAGEVLAVDDRRFRLGLWRGTRTGANLARGGPALLCFVAPGTVLYVRGTGRHLFPPPGSSMDCFEILVEAVETDAHAGLPVTGGLTFGLESMDPAVLIERWRSQIGALRSA
jgi:hypothetical protein